MVFSIYEIVRIARVCSIGFCVYVLAIFWIDFKNLNYLEPKKDPFIFCKYRSAANHINFLSFSSLRFGNFISNHSLVISLHFSLSVFSTAFISTSFCPKTLTLKKVLVN